MQTRTSKPWAALRVALVLAVAALSAAAAWAQQTPDPARAAQMKEQFEKRFAAADTKGDGKLTRQEAEAGMPFVFKHFDEIDTGHTGTVTRQDIIRYIQATRGSRGAEK
jgi:Ca2+-binding EF-hand superfamily protein